MIATRKAARALVISLLPAVVCACARTRAPEAVPPPAAPLATPLATPLAAPRAAAQTGGKLTVTRVTRQQLKRQMRLPADLLAYRDIAIYPKVPGFIDFIGVDRGSTVRKGQLLISMSAPELKAQSKGEVEQAKSAHDESLRAQASLVTLEQELAAARAKLKADEDTCLRLKEAAAYPGVIAANDIEQSEKLVEAERARVSAYASRRQELQALIGSAASKEKAAGQTLAARQDMEAYLRIAAPFDGIITERNVHEGSFVQPPSGNGGKPLLRLQQVSLLRLVVPVPESDVGNISAGRTVSFCVPAFNGESFTGVIKRIEHALDLNTRTMAVEMDVANPQGRLAPGMFAEVAWISERKQPTLFVPKSAVVRTTERTFVIRIKNGTAEWVDVKVGGSGDGLLEVYGQLQDGDLVAASGSDELRPGTTVSTSIR